MAEGPQTPASDQVEDAETELWQETIGRSGCPWISYRVVAADREIVLHLTATLPRPQGARAQAPLLHGLLFLRLFSDLPERFGALLAECLRPASEEQP